LLLADQLDKAGRIEEGLTVIARALAQAENTGERYSLAELHRMKGELMIKAAERLQTSKRPRNPRSKSNPMSAALVQARSCFAEALTIAKQQQTKSWEWRAAVSMDRVAALL
jgi:hypothetical protein